MMVMITITSRATPPTAIPIITFDSVLLSSLSSVDVTVEILLYYPSCVVYITCVDKKFVIKSQHKHFVLAIQASKKLQFLCVNLCWQALDLQNTTFTDKGLVINAHRYLPL